MNLRGLYAITDNDLIPATQLIDAVTQAILGGARVIQYRNKNQDKIQSFSQAQVLQILCRQYRIPLLINDDVELAIRVKADGVHLGKTDMDITTARSHLGSTAIIGVSCYNQFALAQQAIATGATYIAFGSFFSSKTKPQAVPATVALLREARQLFTCPIVAIGGITPENGATLVTAGADCLAVVNGLFGRSDIRTAAQEYARLFS